MNIGATLQTSNLIYKSVSLPKSPNVFPVIFFAYTVHEYNSENEGGSYHAITYVYKEQNSPSYWSLIYGELMRQFCINYVTQISNIYESAGS